MNITSTVTGNVTGNVTGDVTGNVTGNLTGDVSAGVITATSSIVVGDKFISAAGVGIGSTTARVGVNTALGTLILNTTTNRLEVYGLEGWVNIKSVVNRGLTATGGVISDYESGGTIYRSHIFTSSGTFEVTAVSDTLPNNVDYLVVAGGGAGGAAAGGGGGAGGLKSTDPVVPVPARATPIEVSTSPGTYTVTVGAGGQNSIRDRGGTGSPSAFGPVTTSGGGGGGVPVSIPSGNNTGNPGGSGGGASGNTAGQYVFGAAGVPGEGFAGGSGYHSPGWYIYGGGGGGASEAGENAPNAGSPVTVNNAGDGGRGFLINITGIATHFGGGGGGGTQPGPSDVSGGHGGLGGGGAGQPGPSGSPAVGGAGFNAGESKDPTTSKGGHGGSGTGGGGGGAHQVGDVFTK
jgi:hypothetical protein